MPQSVTIRRPLPRAFDVVKGMQAQGLEWGEGYRGLGREAIAVILAGQMDRWWQRAVGGPACGFRRCRPGIPIDVGHLFRSKSAGRSD